jgi:hypothetical protein
MASVTQRPVKSHYHSIADLPIGQGPDKLALSEDVFPPPQDSSGGNLDILADTDFVTIDTTDFEPLLFLPPMSDGPNGRSVTFRIVAGFLSAIINPAGLDEGVNGPPGSIYVLDALEGSVTFRADTSRQTWWKV